MCDELLGQQLCEEWRKVRWSRREGVVMCQMYNAEEAIVCTRSRVSARQSVVMWVEVTSRCSYYGEGPLLSTFHDCYFFRSKAERREYTGNTLDCVPCIVLCSYIAFHHESCQAWPHTAHSLPPQVTTITNLAWPETHQRQGQQVNLSLQLGHRSRGSRITLSINS